MPREAAGLAELKPGLADSQLSRFCYLREAIFLKCAFMTELQFPIFTVPG